MNEWSATVKVGFSPSKSWSQVAEIVSALPGARSEGAGKAATLEAPFALKDYGKFVEVCQLASHLKAFEAKVGGVRIKWSTHKRVLLCGADRARFENTEMGNLYCQGGPREAVIQPVQPYPAPCKLIFHTGEFELPWLSEYGRADGDLCWMVNKTLIREHALTAMSLQDMHICPWMPFQNEAALDEYLSSLPDKIKINPKGPYEISEGILELRMKFPDHGISREDMEEFKRMLDGGELFPEDDK